MRACILSPCVQKHMVLVSMYKSYFEERGIEYDFIYPDKYHQAEESNAKTTYRFEVEGDKGQLKTLLEYSRFIKYAKSILSKVKYDIVVVWTEVAAALFTDFLCSKYNGEFIVVVLDLFNEKRVLKNPYILSARLNKAILHSKFATVSAPGYIKYLTNKRDYLFVHNINMDILPPIKERKRLSGEPITILYSGHISYPSYANKMVERFSNDNRFFLRIIGADSESVGQYAEEIGCHNIEVLGRFESKMTNSILSTADIIYNVYGNEFHCEQAALSNKLYYAASMNIPILVSSNTEMERITHDLGIGFTIDFWDEKNICDELFSWYEHFNQNQSRKSCADFLEAAKDSHQELYAKLDEAYGLK